MNYILSQVAVDELEQILQYIHAENPAAAKRYAAIFREAFLFLCENPYIAPVSEEDEEVFLWSIPNTMYSLPYMVKGNEIHILSVFAQRRKRPSSWLRENQ